MLQELAMLGDSGVVLVLKEFAATAIQWLQASAPGRAGAGRNSRAQLTA